VIGADRQRSGPSCVLLKRVPQGRTESGGIVLAANARPRVPSGGITHKRRCTYRPSVIYLIVNKLLSLSLCHYKKSIKGNVLTYENGSTQPEFYDYHLIYYAYSNYSTTTT
jgi:hypothetical protein